MQKKPPNIARMRLKNKRCTNFKKKKKLINYTQWRKIRENKQTKIKYFLTVVFEEFFDQTDKMILILSHGKADVV